MNILILTDEQARLVATVAPEVVPQLEGVLPEGYAVNVEDEGGQPNGLGEIEPSSDRVWFTPDRETHHRQVWTVEGPWQPTPTQAAARQRELLVRRLERDKRVREARILARKKEN